MTGTREALRRPVPGARGQVAIRHRSGERAHGPQDYHPPALRARPARADRHTTAWERALLPTIAAATPADLPAIFQLLDDNRLPRAGLAAHLATTLVARDDGALVGTAALELYGTAALLRSVAVGAARRGRGLGRALTAAALDLGRRRGVATVYLLTETAGEFFPKLGFRPIARADVDAVVLGSAEFTTACPKSALVMVRSLR